MFHEILTKFYIWYLLLDIPNETNIGNKLCYTGDLKEEKSHDFFKGTRVSSCSHVVVKGGVALAEPYYAKPKQSYADKMGKSSYTASLS